MAIPKPLPRVAAFEKMGLGMFVHWGLYSQLSKGEWIYFMNKLNMDEYKKLAETFTAEDFDADELVLTAKRAGCKYITLTTRHHEGFSLYDTKGLSTFDAPHSAAGRDLIREFVDACNRHSILPFFYHTTLDWYNGDFNNDFDKYLDYLHKSVEILCTNYGRIGGLWFDGNWSKPAGTDWKEDNLYAIIRKHQPDAIIVNNTGLDALGKLGNPEIDSVTFEQNRPVPMNREGMSKYIAAEMCHTLNDHWGFGSLDFNYQSPKSIIEHLCACRRVGANYLLNIGPTAQGGIDPMQKALMAMLGKWMELYGEAIYEGKPYNTAPCDDKNFILKGENALYIFIHDLSRGGNYSFSSVEDELESIEWMDNAEKLDFTHHNGSLNINATGFPYGVSTCVRVARAKIKK